MKKSLVAALVCIVCIMSTSLISASARTKRVDVKFKPGASGGAYNDSLIGYDTVDFYLNAKGGQTMSVKLTSANTFLYFVVLRGSGQGDAVAEKAREVNEWSGELPSDGTYVVRVYLVRAEARRNHRPVSFNVRLGIN
jgi:hypothetical protein